ncbi:MAG: hypothetical protein ACJ71O_11805, partial [Nitrososphaeraceae archaeon]
LHPLHKIPKMSNNQNIIKYVKHNKVRIKKDKRQETAKLLLEFFKILEEKPTGMKGFLVMDAMDEFYKPDNTTLADLVENLKPSFEQLPAREDYQVIQFKV